ncbi:MerR family transcriptional regulator [Candidatus Bathyarchaeota archaeon]|nr:MerR family transcriptional regulator [Candidatus Bathyarchaeota archaeon]
MKKQKKKQQKIEKKLYTIGEVVDLLGVHIDTLRNWDEKGILKAVRATKTGRRMYRREDIEKLLNKNN